jgi:adenosylcobyric acid synthase
LLSWADRWAPWTRATLGCRKESLSEVVAGSLDRVRAEYDVVVIEGAGSPAEINLRRGDIVKMEVALHAGSPVLLVGDIDKGGIFASLYGTVELVAPEERALIKGMVVNKFRGDASLLQPGLAQIRELTDVPVLGVAPYFKDIYISEADSPARRPTDLDPEALIDVAVIALPHISNSDDFDPLGREAGVSFRYVRSPEEMGEPDMVVLPGTKTTASDMKHLRESGMADVLLGAAAKGAAVVGVCGGYQMLGRAILDPLGIESSENEVRGLGLLPVVTRFSAEKQTHRVSGTVEADYGLLEGACGLPLSGYEIHMGTTVLEPSSGPGSPSVPFRVSIRSEASVDAADGSLSSAGWVMGTYVHGLFHSPELRRSMLRRLAARGTQGTDTLEPGRRRLL